MKKLLVFTSWLIFAFYSFDVYGSVFDLTAIGNRAHGMGGAMTAIVEDPICALFYNPAALTGLDGQQINFGVFTFDYPVHHQRPDGYDETNCKELPICPYFAYSTDRLGPFVFAIGQYGAAGVGYRYRADPDHGVNSELFSESGQVLLSPSIGYRVTPKLSLGAGLNIGYVTLEMKFPLSDVSALKLDGDGFCWGGNLAVHYQLNQRISLGLRWRSPMRSVVRGDARIRGITPEEKHHLKATLYWPQYLTLGIGYRPSSRLVFALDLEWIDWSTFTRSHFDYKDVELPAVEKMRDARRIHFGLEYYCKENLALRLGYLHNPWCIKSEAASPLLAGQTHRSVHIGAGWKFKPGWRFDASLQYNFPKSRTVYDSLTGYPGRYTSECQVFDIQVSYKF